MVPRFLGLKRCCLCKAEILMYDLVYLRSIYRQSQEVTLPDPHACLVIHELHVVWVTVYNGYICVPSFVSSMVTEQGHGGSQQRRD